MGLSELIGILKEAIESDVESPAAIVRSIVLHVSNEMDSIIAEMKAQHGEAHPVLKEAARKTVAIEREAKKVETTPPEKTVEAIRKPVAMSDDLMKSLKALRERTIEEREEGGGRER